MDKGGVPKQRMYSEFWSNREYVYVTKGEKLNDSVPSTIRKKITKVASGLREVEFAPAIDDSVIAELLDSIAHVLRIKGYDELATHTENVATVLKEKALSGLIKNR